MNRTFGPQPAHWLALCGLIALAGWGTGCGSPPANRQRPDTVPTLQLTGGQLVRLPGGREIAPKELGPWLRQDDSDRQPTGSATAKTTATVRIAADDSTTCGVLRQVVQECSLAGRRDLRLQGAGWQLPFTAPEESALGAAPPEGSRPTTRLQLQADAAGALVRITLEDAHVPHISDLPAALREADGRMSLAADAPLVVSIETDDRLLFLYLSDVIAQLLQPELNDELKLQIHPDFRQPLAADPVEVAAVPSPPEEAASPEAPPIYGADDEARPRFSKDLLDLSMARKPAQPAAPECVWEGGFAPRQPDVRAQAQDKETAAAVERAIAWIAAQQEEDGGWTFRSQEGEPVSDDRVSATALALLPLLAQGENCPAQPRQEAVWRGLQFLVGQAHAFESRAMFQPASRELYPQALGTLAIAEAYGMTRDARLSETATGAVQQLLFAQDPEGGGWGPLLQQPGKTDISCWNALALRTAGAATLEVPAEAFAAAAQFAAAQPAKGDPTAGAQLLYLRLLAGDAPTEETMRAGLSHLAARGPSLDGSLQYNLLGSLALHHQPGAPWAAWRAKLFPHLLATQSADDASAGSWHFPTPSNAAAKDPITGPLYQTALATLVLQTEYRSPF